MKSTRTNFTFTSEKSQIKTTTKLTSSRTKIRVATLETDFCPIVTKNSFFNKTASSTNFKRQQIKSNDRTLLAKLPSSTCYALRQNKIENRVIVDKLIFNEERPAMSNFKIPARTTSNFFLSKSKKLEIPEETTTALPSQNETYFPSTTRISERKNNFSSRLRGGEFGSLRSLKSDHSHYGMYSNERSLNKGSVVKIIDIKRERLTGIKKMEKDLRMDKAFFNHFKASELKQQSNLLEVKHREQSSLIKLSYLKDTPENQLTQKLRAKRSKLVKDFPKLFKSSKSDQTILVVSLSPLFFLNVDRVNYCYMRRPVASDSMKKQDVIQLLENFKADLRKEMHASRKYKYLFDRQGGEYLNIYDVINGSSTLFISPLPTIKSIEEELARFGGIDNSRFYETLTALEKFVESENHNSKIFMTHEEIIGRKYHQEKEEIINFVGMSDEGISSKNLENVYQKVVQGKIDLSSLGKMIGTVKPSYEFLKRNIIDDPSKSNQVISYLRNTNPKYFKAKFGIHKKDNTSRTGRLNAIVKELGMNPPDEMIKDIVESVRSLYLNEDEPIFQDTRYKVVSLLCKYYVAQIRQGTTEADDEYLIKNYVIDELIKLAKPERELDVEEKDELFSRVLKNTLEFILRKNKYKLMDVEIDDYMISPESNPDDNAPLSEEGSTVHIQQLDELSILNIWRGKHIQENSEKSDNDNDNIIFAPEEHKRNFIEKNKIAVMNQKTVLKTITETNVELVSQNIPYISHETKFTRNELHSFYIMFKALSHATSQRYGIMEYDIKDGLDKHCFQKGIFQVFIQAQELADTIFYSIDYNFSGFMDWSEFINGMKIIKAKTVKDKIDLFIKMADEDGNGLLSWDEIYELCENCLKKFIGEKDKDFLLRMAEFFAKFIFDTLGVDVEEEIPFETIKDHILNNRRDANLLLMFCGADF